MRLIALLVLLSTACVRFSTPEAPNWRNNGVADGGMAPARWPSLPVRWSFMCGFDDVPEFRSGFEWWNKAYDGGIFEEVDPEASCVCKGDGCPQVVVYGFLGVDSPIYLDAGVSRFAATFLVSDGGTITRGTVRYFAPFLDADDESRESIARHEAGHILGFMHTLEPRECLMYPTIQPEMDRPKTICPGEDALFRKVYGR